MASPQVTTGSTMPRRKLGRQLRDLRTRAKITTRSAAERLEWSEAKIWRIETGQTSLRSLDVEAMCKIYGAPDDLVPLLARLARETKSRGWWTGYADAIPAGREIYIGLEEAAAGLFIYSEGLVPEILQTPDYHRAVLECAYPELTAADIDRREEVRAARAEQHTRVESQTRLHVTLADTVLRRDIGGSRVRAGQLVRLRELAARPETDIRVLPPEAPYHPGLVTGGFTLLDFGDADTTDIPEPPLVYLEPFTGPVYLDKAADVQRYQAAYSEIHATGEQLSAVAMS